MLGKGEGKRGPSVEGRKVWKALSHLPGHPSPLQAAPGRLRVATLGPSVTWDFWGVLTRAKLCACSSQPLGWEGGGTPRYPALTLRPEGDPERERGASTVTSEPVERP